LISYFHTVVTILMQTLWCFDTCVHSISFTWLDLKFME